MILGKVIYVIDSHTAGEPTRVIVGGIPYLVGGTITEKAAYFKDNFDYIRTALFQEPRGLLRGEGALITSPTNSEAQLGVFFMNSKSPLVRMCVHGSMGVITTAIEFGMVDVVKPITTVVLDTPAGLVTGHAKVSGGTVESVSIRNVASFLYQSTTIEVPNLGSIPVDVAYGGGFCAIIEAGNVGSAVDTKNISRLCELARIIRDAVNAQIKVNYPRGTVSQVNGIRFFDKPTNRSTHIRNVTISRGGIDRSPCGVSTSAHLAALYARGEIQLNEECLHESIVGTAFKSKLVEHTKTNGFDAVIPEIIGSAYITGINTFVLSPDDPMRNGFLIEM